MAPSPPDRTRRVLSASQRRRHVLGFADCSATHAAHAARQPDHLVLTRSGALLLDSVSQRLEAGTVALTAFALLDRTALVAGSLDSVGAPWRPRPVVVVWGEHQGDVPAGGTTRFGVTFLRGSELGRRLRREARYGDVLDARAARQLWHRLLTDPTHATVG